MWFGTQKLPFHPALKGLKLLYRSGSLSSTDLINNFYQPLAEKKKSAGGGVGRGNWGVGVVYEKGFRSRFSYMRQVVYIMIRACSHNRKNSMGGCLCLGVRCRAQNLQHGNSYLLHMITTSGSILLMVAVVLAQASGADRENRELNRNIKTCILRATVCPERFVSSGLFIFCCIRYKSLLFSTFTVFLFIN